MLINVIYSRPIGQRWSAYVGGGVGGVFSTYANGYGYSTPTASAFGFQGMVGFKYALSKNWDMGIGYKLLGTTGYDVGSGVAYDGSTPTDYKSDGNLTQSVLLTFAFKY